MLNKILYYLFCLHIILTAVKCDASIDDTYANALQHSHQTNSVSDRSSDVSFHASQAYEYPAAKPEYGPPPQPEYGPPPPEYGAPPAPVYGHPPAPVYGHPPAPHYGPPPQMNHPPAFYHPREESWLEKLKIKFDLFTIGKILLKLIIFKKILKFGAMICLLLFLPKLKALIPVMMDEDARDFGSDTENLNEKINEVSKFATTALETFSRKYDGCKGDQIWCRFKRTIDVIDDKYPYDRIVRLYLPKTEVHKA